MILIFGYGCSLGYFITAGLNRFEEIKNLSQVLKRRGLNHPEFPTKGSEFIWDFTYSGGFLGGIEDSLINLFTVNLEQDNISAI